MSWRTVCITERCKLEYRMGYMIIRREKTEQIHLSEIGTLIIESLAVSMTASLLCELANSKIKVIFCDGEHNPYGELMAYNIGYKTSHAIREQVDWSTEIKSRVWQLMVRDKIRKQALILARQEKYDEEKLLLSYIPQVEINDNTNREGFAAKVYFNALKGMEFSRDDACVFNAALNYGYSLLLSSCNKEVSALGYISQIGIWHDNMFNPFNLGCDLMEVFRPWVDQYVLKMNLGESSELTKENKHHLIRILESEMSVNGKTYKLSNAIRIYVQKVTQMLSDGGLGGYPLVEYVF